MIAYVTTVGERTLDACVSQLNRYGFDTVVLYGKEKWIDKYSRFLRIAKEPCIRVDADIVVNHRLKDAIPTGDCLMAQFSAFDVYRLDVHAGHVVYYTPEAVEIISKHLKELDPERPETAAWRLPEFVDRTITVDEVVGIHGLRPYEETLERHLKHRKDRNQDIDFDWIEQFREVLKK